MPIPRRQWLIEQAEVQRAIALEEMERAFAMDALAVMHRRRAFAAKAEMSRLRVELLRHRT